MFFGIYSINVCFPVAWNDIFDRLSPWCSEATVETALVFTSNAVGHGRLQHETSS